MLGYAKIEYMCSFCGKKVSRLATTGKPAPDKCEAKKKKDGSMGPHSWKINRKY